MELGRKTKSIESNEEYFRAVATPNREKPKGKDIWRVLLVFKSVLLLFVPPSNFVALNSAESEDKKIPKLENTPTIGINIIHEDTITTQPHF